MGNPNKLVCRLCLEMTPPCENEPIEETKKEILKVLLINMDFDISDYAVACSRCVELLQNCFEFKSYVINNFTEVDLKVDIKEEGFQSYSRSPESSQICRLCKTLIGNETLNHTVIWKDGVLLKDMMRCCFPKMDLNTAHEPVICKKCLSSTRKYYKFMKSCQDVEEKIEDFSQKTGLATAGNKVILDDMLKFKDCDVIGKQLIIKNEEANMICEEIHIKDELDNVVETNDTNQTEDGLSATEETVGKTATKGKIHFCPKCDYSTNRCSSMKRHILIHNKVRRCNVCNFVTDTSLSLQAHMVSHRGLTKRYGCSECTFETNRKSNLDQHSLKHKDSSEVKMYKCPSCPHKTKYKKAIMGHQKTHEDPKVANYFQCGKCPYKTKWKSGLKKHVMTHLIEHQYSCDQCPYSSKIKRNLVKHQLNHYTNGERQMNKCNLCAYQARATRSLRDHMIKAHTDPSEAPCLKCTHCPYETAIKRSLKAHIKQRHSTEKQPELKCELCPYVTTEKQIMQAHSFVHLEATIQCYQCDFRTKWKRSLVRHIKQYHTGSHSSSKQLTFKSDQRESSARGQGESKPAPVEANGAGGGYDIPLPNMRQMLKKQEEGGE